MASALLSRALCALAVFALLILPVPAAVAAGYEITAPLEGVCRQDMPPCTPFNLVGTPSVSGDYVIFTSGFNAADAVWSYRISKKKLRKLAGFETKVPDGKGRFTAFGSAGSDFPTTVGGDRVAFHGWDQANRPGIYTVSVKGGPISRIVSQKTRAPGIGEKFSFLRFAALNGKTVAFWGTTAGGVEGIYRTDVDGRNLQKIVDSEEPLTAHTPSGLWEDYFDTFSRPTVGKSSVQFYARGSVDPSSGFGPNALFRAKGDLVDIADNMTSLEGGVADAHVRIDTMSAASQTAGVVFEAAQPGNAFFGLFRAKNVDEAVAFVTNKTPVPDTPYTFAEFRGFGYDESGLAFAGIHFLSAPQSDWSVYFIDRPGREPVLVASGDDYLMPIVGDRSISGGVVVFVENTNTNETFYIASPKK